MFTLNFRNITLITLSAIGIATLGAMSCSKKVDTATYSQFIGEWNIKDDCSGFKTPKVKISAGSNNYSVVVNYSMGYLNPNFGPGYDVCQREVTLKGAVNSTANKDYISMGNQVVTDKCGNTYTVSGGAYIKLPTKPEEEDTLLITLVTTTTGGSSACNFSGYLKK